MTDKMPAEIWVIETNEARSMFTAITKERPGLDLLERYIHEFHYTRLLEAYRKNLELLMEAPCPYSTAHLREYQHIKCHQCDCWKSEIEEVEGI